MNHDQGGSREDTENNFVCSSEYVVTPIEVDCDENTDIHEIGPYEKSVITVEDEGSESHVASDCVVVPESAGDKTPGNSFFYFIKRY